MISPTFPVIYLTGAPATGKSTLSRNLAAKFPALRVFAYSDELRRHLAHRAQSALTEDSIRELSAKVVTSDDIVALDTQLVNRVRTERAEAPFLIDSHPVTKEDYGFRVTAFNVETLRALNPDVIVCLYTSPAVLIERIRSTPMGRPMVREFEAKMHIDLQASVATQYGVLLGKPVYLIDSSIAESDLVATVAARARLDGLPSE